MYEGLVLAFNYLITIVKHHVLAIMMALYLLTTGISCKDFDRKAGSPQVRATDTTYINQLTQSALINWASDPDSMVYLGEKALKLSMAKNYAAGEANASSVLGTGYHQQGEYTRSVSHYSRALFLADSLSDHRLKARIHNNISLPLLALGKHEEALQHGFAALSLGEKLDMESTVAHAYTNIGITYHHMADHDQALAYYHQSRSAYEAMGDSTKMTFILGNIAHIHMIREEYSQATEYYNTSLRLAQNQGNQKAIGNALTSLGNASLQQGDARQALDYLSHAKSMFEAIGEREQYLRVLHNLADSYRVLQHDEQALHYAQEGYHLARKQQYLHYIISFTELLSDLYAEAGDYKLALSYHKESKNTADSLFGLNKNEEIVRLEERFKYEQNQRDIESAYIHQLNRKQYIVYLLVVSSVFLLGLIALLVRHLHHKRKANKILHQTNERIARQHVLLEEANTFKSHLISIVAHDIRSPIASLRMVLDLINDESLPEEKKRQLIASTYNEAEKLSNFLDDLLLWVMRQLRDQKVEKSTCNIGGLIQETVNLYQQQAKNRDIHLSFSIEGDTTTYADVETVKIVLRNLVDNALKFCQAKDRVNIIASKDTDTGRVKVSVSDTGPGMDEQTLESLFSLTSDKDAQKKDKLKNGLGLILCQQYLTLHDSTLHVESKHGEGSTFWFVL